MVDNLTAFAFLFLCFVAFSTSQQVCEHAKNDEIKLTCPADEEIYILHAVYGRTSTSICPAGARGRTNCRAASSERLARARCDGTNYCALKAANSMFGDPCVGITKYLDVKYTCVNVACPGSQHICEHAKNNQIKLTCSTGQKIHILSALYGRTSTSICPAGARGRINCRAASSGRVVRARCDGKVECVLRAANSMFGDPCVGITKYLHVRYKCVKTALSGAQHVCEHAKNDQIKLTCSTGQKIHILFALYGRTSTSICPAGARGRTNCRAASSERVARARCDGKGECILKAANSMFGDPCGGITKYLQVRYRCVKIALPGTQHVCENATNDLLKLTCPRGQQIHILFALYGRTSTSICPAGARGRTNCRAASSERVAWARCDGRGECILKAANSMFGDPCVGVTKYLQVRYRCVERVLPWNPRTWNGGFLINVKVKVDIE